MWLYYIVNYALFAKKRFAEDLGLEKHTFSGSDYNRENNKLPDNIWSRWIRFRCTVQNHWDNREFNVEFDTIDLDLDAQSNLNSDSTDIEDITPPIRDEP